MKYFYSNKELFNYFEEVDTNEIDFIANISSGWHLNILYSFLLIKRDVKDLKGIIIINPQSNIENKSRIRIKENMIIKLDGVHVDYLTNMKADNFKSKSSINVLNSIIIALRIHRKNSKKLWLLSPYGFNIQVFNYLENIKNYREVIMVSLDEGLGSYISEMNFVKSLMQSSSIKMNLLIYLKNLTKISFKKFLLLLLKAKGYNFIKYNLYTANNKKLITNSNVSKKLSEIFKIHSKYANNIDDRFKKNQILILKDLDNHLMDISDITCFYAELIKEIRMYSEKEIYIKKHPNDVNVSFDEEITKNKNVKILDLQIDAEQVYLKLEPEVLLGGVSTSIFSIPTIFEVEAITFSKLYKNYKASRNLHEKIDTCEKQFSYDQRIKFLEEIQDLKFVFSRRKDK